jgi:hypothetical protein
MEPCFRHLFYNLIPSFFQNYPMIQIFQNTHHKNPYETSVFDITGIIVSHL